MARRKKRKKAAPTISELKFARVAMIILGIMFLIFGFWLIVCLPVAAVCFYASYVYKKEIEKQQEILSQRAELERRKELIQKRGEA